MDDSSGSGNSHNQPPIKRAKQTSLAGFLVRPCRPDNTEENAEATPINEGLAPDPASSADAPSTKSATAACAHSSTVADQPLATGEGPFDVADALELRRQGRLERTERLRFAHHTLKVDADYKFPFTESANRKYYAGIKHITGIKYNCFYFSPKLSGLLCLPCVLFAPETVGKAKQQLTGRLVTEPLCTFKKLTGKDSYLDTHIMRGYHEDAVKSLEALISTEKGGDISARLETQRSKQIQRNREILKAIIHEIETCGRLNIALRGGDDAGPIEVPRDMEHVDYTAGNLRALLQKSSLLNPVLAQHFQDMPKNATYLSPQVQNDLILCIGSFIMGKVASSIKQAKFFAVQADETSDFSRMEQMTVTVRFVDSTSLQICESFTGFIELEEQTGAAMATKLSNHIRRLGLDPDCCVGQGYDGASSMSGEENGVQALLRRQCPKAVYVHCFSHRLNLVLSKATEVIEIRAALTTIKDACNHFSHSPQRERRFKAAIAELCPSARHERLKQYCATRWVERHDSIFIFLELYQPLLKVLNDSGEIALANAITDPGFLVAVHLLEKVLGVSKQLSVLLQSKDIDLVEAASEIKELKQTIDLWRSDGTHKAFAEAFEKSRLLYAKVEEVSDAEIPMPRKAGRQRHRSNVPADTPAEHYRRSVWYPFLDQVSAELDYRFSGTNRVVSGITAFVPAYCHDSTAISAGGSFEQYAEFLSDGVSACLAEYGRWQRKWAEVLPDDRPKTIGSSLSACAASSYPNILVILKIFATIPVTTATAERSFSQLRRQKTYLRSTMGNDRLNGLAMMAVHKEIPLEYDKVIDEYCRSHNPRLKLS